MEIFFPLFLERIGLHLQFLFEKYLYPRGKPALLAKFTALEDTRRDHLALNIQIAKNLDS